MVCKVKLQKPIECTVISGVARPAETVENGIGKSETATLAALKQCNPGKLCNIKGAALGIMFGDVQDDSATDKRRQRT